MHLSMHAPRCGVEGWGRAVLTNVFTLKGYYFERTRKTKKVIDKP
jgi:hypothetical protein